MSALAMPQVCETFERARALRHLDEKRVVIFAGGGIHALIEGDLIDGHYLSSVPTNDWIGLYPYVECLAAQAIAAIAVLALFAVGFARKRKLRTPDNRK